MKHVLSLQEIGHACGMYVTTKHYPQGHWRMETKVLSMADGTFTAEVTVEPGDPNAPDQMNVYSMPRT